MLTWMLYVLITTLLLSGAGFAAEYAARLRGVRTRWIWALTIIASLVVPIVIASVSIQIPSLQTPAVSQKITALRELTSVHIPPLTWVRERTGASSGVTPGANLILQRAWVTISATLSAALLLNGAYLLWRRRRWKTGTVAGVSVYIAPDVGPAVVGLLRPRIVVPAWLAEASPSRQMMVIAHEQAHLAAHDPQLLTMALSLLVLMPWNLPLWWQLHRLRYAIEVDCDARVINSGLDTRQYGATLIDVSQRSSAYIGSAAAMSESRSFLEERIRIMVSDPAKRGTAAAAIFGLMALALAIVATQIIPPNASGLPDTKEHPVTLSPAVLDRHVGFYVRGGHVITTITRDGPHLLVQFPGYAPVRLDAHSDTQFGHKDGLSLSFVRDGQGQTTGLVDHMAGISSFLMPRVDAAVAQQILASNEAKKRSGTVTPGSEAALRRMINGIRAGKPNYDEMAPWFAQILKDTLYLFAPVYAEWGDVQSITFRHVDMTGADVYEVRQERGFSTWSIVLDSNGLIADADHARGR